MINDDVIGVKATDARQTKIPISKEKCHYVTFKGCGTAAHALNVLDMKSDFILYLVSSV